MIILIGIDDTDNPETRGTGFQARTMAEQLTARAGVSVLGITRHQHFVHPDIPYTSHNSSACLRLEAEDPQAVWHLCSTYLAAAAAPGSDAGLALALPGQITDPLIAWAFSTKSSVVTMDQAYNLAISTGILLEGFTGNRQGIIGALASVALCHNGNDGRFIATRGNYHLRQLPAGIYLAKDLLKITRAGQITDLQYNLIPMDAEILVSDYLRPVLRNQNCIILVTKTEQGDDWESAGKDIIGNY